MSQDDYSMFDGYEGEPSEQQRNLERVTERIGRAVKGFCEALKTKDSKQFHAEDLRNFVRAHCGHTAPGSADRILRHLRQEGLVHYKVVSRKGSLYELLIENERG